LSQSAPLTEPKYLLPFVLVTSLFFVWSIGVNLNDVLIPHFKKAFDLADFQSSFIQVAFFGGYFLAAFPAGRLLETIGYKKGILVGLLICAAGTLLFLPAASSRLYGFFLLALFVMSSGQSFLEVGAGGKLGTAAEYCPVVQRRGRCPRTNLGRRVHSFWNRVHAGAKSCDESATDPGLHRFGSEYG
jgi:MFS family permease